MELVQQALGALVGRGDVAGAAVVSAEGLVIVSRLAPQVDAEAVAALGTTLMRDGGQLARQVGRGAAARVLVEAEGGMLLACGLSDGTVLVVVAEEGAAVGQLLYDLRLQRGALAALL